jgi:Fur family ferric uptake transcriptional regulator
MGAHLRELRRGLQMSIAPRKTKQKQAIRDSFVVADRPLSPDEVLALAKQQVDGMSIATVYRNIGSLVEDGWLASVELPGTAARYEVAGKKHHHHFQCKECEKVYELSGCDIAVKPNLPKGFRLTGHDFFLYGVCSACR